MSAVNYTVQSDKDIWYLYLKYKLNQYKSLCCKQFTELYLVDMIQINIFVHINSIPNYQGYVHQYAH